MVGLALACLRVLPLSEPLDNGQCEVFGIKGLRVSGKVVGLKEARNRGCANQGK